MAASLLGRSIVLVRGIGVSSSPVGGSSYIHTSSLLNEGYRQRRKDAFMLGVTHSWPSRGGVRKDQIPLLQDLYIRKLIQGTFPGVKQVIQKKTANNIIVTFWVNLTAYRYHPPSLYFLSGYTETILTHWLGCNVRVIVRGYYKETKVIRRTL